MSASESGKYALLDQLAEEFAARFRRGERPSLKEYLDRYPDLAADIRELFPAMVEVEQAEGDRRAVEPVAATPRLEQLGDFRILREIGQGGMGIVYEAEQVSLGRHVALKVLPHKLLDARQRRRFEREARAAGKLHHTNIVPVFGVGEQDGLPYYVMQFIQGLGLDEVLEELRRMRLGSAPTTAPTGGLHVSRKDVSAADVARSLMTGEFRRDGEAGGGSSPPGTEGAPSPAAAPPAAGRLSDSFTLSASSVVLPRQSGRGKRHTYWQSVADIGVQVASALEYAHRQGVLHRDVKPSNLLLDTCGTVWVTDFGLAKADDQQNLTHTGDILGTLRYMPPEAFEGKSDARGDVYSLGLTLYEMLALRPAFDEKERHKLIKQVTQQEPPRLGKLNRQVPRDLETIVHKAIDKDPRQRYASAGALAEDLQRFIEDEPIQARRVGPTERLRRWCRRNPVVAGLMAALGLVLLAGFVAVAWKWQEAERQKDAAQAAERGEAAQRAVAVEQAKLATNEVRMSRRLLYASDMNLAGQAWEAGTTGRARAVLERHLPQPGQEDLRGFEWRYLWRLCQDGTRDTFRAHAGGNVVVAFSPDGQVVATCNGEDSSVRLWHLASRRQFKLLANWAGSVAFTPDGKALAITQRASRAVRLWDLAERRERATFPHPADVHAVAFSPDGKLMATACDDATVRLWDVGAGREVGDLRGHKKLVRCVAFARDGKALASGSLDGTVRLWDVAARSAVATFEGHTALVTSLSFSPDGSALASASTDSTVRIWDVAARRQRMVLRGPRTAVLAAAYSPDGKSLAAGGGDGTIRAWDAVTGELVALLRGHTAAVTGLAYAPDGQSLVSGCHDGTVKVWDVTARGDPNVLTGHRTWYNSVAFSPDGKVLAVGDYHDESVKLCDVASRQQIAVLKDHGGPVWCLAFSPDRQTLAIGGDKKGGLWDVATRKKVAELQYAARPFSLAFSPDGKSVAAGAAGSDSALVWDVASGRELARLTGSTVQFSPDGKLFAAGSRNTVRLWDAATWQQVALLGGHTAGVSCLAFTPDGQTLATGDWDGTLRLWDVARKRQVAGRRVHTAILTCMAFSPDGRRLVTSGGDSIVRLWDVGILQELATLTGHEERVDAAAGERLWAAAWVATLTGHDGPVPSLAFSPDGTLLATGGNDATVRLWPAPSLPAALPGPAELPGVPPATETFHLFSAELSGTARATLAAEGGGHRVDVGAVDGTDWHVKLLQAFDDLQEGATYTVRFRARADAPRPIRLYGQIGEPNWHGIGLNEVVPLTRDWQPYRYEFQAKDLAAWNRIELQVGGHTGTVWVADFMLTKNKVDPRTEEAALLRRRAFLHARAGRWQPAADDYARAVELSPDDHDGWYELAAVRLRLGDRGGYRDACREMLRRFGGAADPYQAERTAKACLIVPGTAPDAEQLVRLTERALVGTQKEWGYPWFLLTRAMAELRAGRPRQAIDWVQKGRKQFDAVPPVYQALAGLFLALAHHQLNEPDKARAALGEAVRVMDTQLPKADGGDLGEGWLDWVFCQVVRREAEGLLGGTGPEPKR
jgi:WD40 repeat protein/serine/threonine protein kinase/predicted negative regulator of RcsB-dependent stress response